MIRLLVAAAIVLPCFGCASVTRGTTENISIATTPAGATAEISGLEIPTACVTPCAIQAKRNADITITVNKPGYRPQTIPLTKEIVGAGAAGFAGKGAGRWPGRHGRGCRHRRGAGSQAQSGDRDTAAAGVGATPRRKTATAQASGAAELSTARRSGPRGAEHDHREPRHRRNHEPKLTRCPRLCDLMSPMRLAYLIPGIATLEGFNASDRLMAGKAF